MKRKGSAIMMAMILGSVFFIAVTSLMRHSSGEVRHVKAVSAVKKAELLALSGIDYAEGKLRKGRWYGTPFVEYEKNVGNHKTFGREKFKPFGSKEGEVLVICEDVANKVPGYNAYGMQKYWTLHHIDVYSMGVFEGQRCLIYGRYIMSPEPLLNDNTTEAAGFASPEFNIPGAVAVSAKKIIHEDEEIENFVVKEVKVSTGQKVDMNTIVAVLNPLNDPDVNIDIRPNTSGNIAEVLLTAGETCRAGDNLAIISKSIITSSGIAQTGTLKKMVRITKIEPEIWKNLDIEKRDDRFTISQYIDGMSDVYLQNFISHASLEDALKNIDSNDLDKKLNANKILNKFPAHVSNTTRNRAENTFLAYMIQNFTVPGGTWNKKEQSLEKTYLALDHPRDTKPPNDLVDWLSELGLSHLMNTKPRLDSRYFDPKMKDSEFINLLRPKFNVSPETFINELSELKDASRFIDIEEGEFGDDVTTTQTEDTIVVVKPGVRVTVEKVSKPYAYVDPVSGFTTEMRDLMTFVRKYYENSSSQSPREDTRIKEHVDWPLPKPAPPPPAPVPGGSWNWIPGTPGVPPGDPTWVYNGGEEKKITPPVAGERDFEAPSSDPDGGKTSYSIPGIAPEDNRDGSFDPGSEADPGTDKWTNVRDPITINEGGKWDGTPGTPGVDPTQGTYVWVADPPPPAEDSTDRECTTCCFAPGTMIFMGDGSKKAIEDVRVGDEVLSFDEKIGKTIIGKVMALEAPTRDHLTTIVFANGKTLRLTDEHPLFTKKGWASLDPGFTFEHHNMRVNKLRVGSEVLDNNSKWNKILSINTILVTNQVYNLAKVEPSETFFADGFLAHNKPTSQSETPGGDPGAGGGGDGTSGTPGTDGTGGGSDRTGGGTPGDASGGGNSGGGGSPGGGGGGGNAGSGQNPGAGGGGSSGGGGGGGSTGTGGTGGSSGGGGGGGSGGSGGGGTGSGGGGGGYTPSPAPSRPAPTPPPPPPPARRSSGAC
jgi:intein/homing endonuclease